MKARTIKMFTARCFACLSVFSIFFFMGAYESRSIGFGSMLLYIVCALLCALLFLLIGKAASRRSSRAKLRLSSSYKRAA